MARLALPIACALLVLPASTHAQVRIVGWAVDPAGWPVAEAVVEGAGAPILTNARGQFVIELARRQDLELRIRGPGLVTRKPIRLAADRLRRWESLGEIRLARTGELRGRVEGGGRVWARECGGEDATTVRARADGTFEFEGLPEACYSVYTELACAEHVPVAAGQSTEVDWRGKRRAPVALKPEALQPGTESLSGRVYRAELMSLSPGPMHPAAGERVAAFQHGRLRAEVKSDANGAFALAVEPGEVLLCVLSGQYTWSSWWPRQVVVVPPGGLRDVVVTANSDGGRLTFRLVGPGGQPLEQAEVIVRRFPPRAGACITRVWRRYRSPSGARAGGGDRTRRAARPGSDPTRALIALEVAESAAAQGCKVFA